MSSADAVTTRASPSRAMAIPASGMATADPAAPESRIRPSTPGLTRSAAWTCGMREAQLAVAKPSPMNATDTASLADRAWARSRSPGGTVSPWSAQLTTVATRRQAALVHPAQHVLVPVDHRPGDHAGAVGEQEHHEVRDLVRAGPSLPIGQRRAGLLPPVVARAVERALGGVLALGRRSSRCSAPLIRIRSQRCACAALRVRPASPALAATYGARNGWPPCADMRDDVDDRARRPAGHHVARRRPA